MLRLSTVRGIVIFVIVQVRFVFGVSIVTRLAIALCIRRHAVAQHVNGLAKQLACRLVWRAWGR